MKQVAAGLATLGRGEDKVLVHMTPGEVHGLQAIALAHGGSLTINPHTGLPEAGFLKNILPAIAAAAAIYLRVLRLRLSRVQLPVQLRLVRLANGAAATGLTGMAGGLYSTLGAQGVGALAGGVTGALTNKENPIAWAR
jgi:hypothetical protein